MSAEPQAAGARAARLALILAAADFLESIGAPAGPFVVTVTTDGDEYRLAARERASRPPPAPQATRGLSALEGKILAAVDPVEYRSSERIADLCGVKCSDGLKAILTNLADAGALEPLSGKGYRRAGGVSLG